jgi:hypothetical protein
MNKFGVTYDNLRGTNYLFKWGLPMPNIASLVGLSFYNECYFLDAAANAIGIVATNGGWGLVGKQGRLAGSNAMARRGGAQL